MTLVRGSRRPPAIILAPIAFVVVGLVAAGITLLPPPVAPVQSGAPAITPPTSPLVVNLARRGGPAAVGFPVQLTAAVIGLSGVSALELWVGGTRVEITETADPARPAATVRWQWTPEAAGEAVLVARAFDARGRGAQSAPLRVTVASEPPRSFRLATATAGDGETLDDVVQRLGGDLELARRLNEDLPAGPLPEGTTVEVPIFDEPVAASASQSRDLADAAPVSSLHAILPEGLAVPTVQVAVEPDCTVTATASDGGAAAAGFAFSALPPIGDAFIPLPPVTPSGDGSATTSFVALGGMNYLTAFSYTSDASAPSAIVPVDVPNECGTAGWTGDAQLAGGKLAFPGSADRAYLYLKVGSGNWGRVPAAAGSFVEPLDGAFDFGPFLPAIAGHDLSLEAWGWLNGALTKLGTGQYAAPSLQLYSGGLAFGGGDPVLGFGTTLDIVTFIGGGEFPEKLAKHSTIDRPGPNSTSGKRTFKWATTLPGVTHLVWQVLPYPLGEQSVSLTPPFLIDSGTIEVQGNTGGYFSIDLKPYLLGDQGGVSSTTLLGEQLINSVVQANPYLPAATKAPGEVFIDPGNIWWPKPTAGTATQVGPAGISKATLEDLSYLIPPPTSLFVRVIPFFGTISMPNASNVVSFDVVEPADPVYIDTSPPPPPPTYLGAYSMDKAIFFAPTGSNAKYAKCVKVVKGGKTAGLPYSIYGGSNWNNGTVHCLPEPDDDGWSLSDAFESFVGWVGDVWDYVSDGYAWMQDQVVNVVLAAVPCEQIASKATCEKIVHTALQAALASFGLPPEIPNWESTIAAAKGDLKTFILENAQSLPGVGDACAAAAIANQGSSSVPTCDEVVDKAVDEAIKKIAAERSAAAAHNAGVLVPPGVTVEPDPRSMAQPPHFEVTLTRTNETLPPDVTCSMYGSMKSVVENWSWKEYEWDDGHPTIVTKGPAQVFGEPFMGAKQIIGPLQPGQTATYSLWLTKRIIWFEPDGWNDHYAEQYAEWNGSFNHAWVLLQTGATVTGTLSSNCFPGGTSVQTLTGQAWN